MQFLEIGDPAEFRSRTELLLQDEARHNLIRGVLAALIEDQDAFDDFRLFVVESDGSALACGLVTLPHRLIVADAPSDPALSVFVAGVEEADLGLGGVIGNKPTVDRFCELWESRTGDSTKLAMSQGIFAASRVRAPRPTQGSGRIATEEDFGFVLGWFNDFIDEAMPDEPRDDARLQLRLRRQLRGEGMGMIWVWQVDGKPVAMSANSSPTGSGVRVNAVYTPPQNRARGFASGLVATQSRWLLENRVDFCFLYTDLANPTSNRIYQAIGYEWVAEAASFDFVSSDRDA